MSDDAREAVERLAAEGVTVDPVEARAAMAVAEGVCAVVEAGAAARLTLDATPWSYDTLRARACAGDKP